MFKKGFHVDLCEVGRGLLKRSTAPDRGACESNMKTRLGLKMAAGSSEREVNNTP